MIKVNEAIAKKIVNMAFNAARVDVNSTCRVKFYQERLDSQTEALRKYHDKKNS